MSAAVAVPHQSRPNKAAAAAVTRQAGAKSWIIGSSEAGPSGGGRYTPSNRHANSCMADSAAPSPGAWSPADRSSTTRSSATRSSATSGRRQVEPDMQFLEPLGRDRRRRAHHQIARLLVHREDDDLADV